MNRIAPTNRLHFDRPTDRKLFQQCFHQTLTFDLACIEAKILIGCVREAYINLLDVICVKSATTWLIVCQCFKRVAILFCRCDPMAFTDWLTKTMHHCQGIEDNDKAMDVADNYDQYENHGDENNHVSLFCYIIAIS